MRTYRIEHGGITIDALVTLDPYGNLSVTPIEPVIIPAGRTFVITETTDADAGGNIPTDKLPYRLPPDDIVR